MGDRFAVTEAQWRRFYWLWLAIGTLYGIILATSLLMEADRFRFPLPPWKAFVDELSAVGVFAALIPLLRWFDDRYPFRREALRRALLAHTLFSAVFTLLAVGGFVTLRSAIYPLFGRQFIADDNLLLGFLYEYRKILVGYAAVLASMYAFRHYLQLQRLLAMPEANAETDMDGGPAESASGGPAPHNAAATVPLAEPTPAGSAPPGRPTLRFVARANHREYLVAVDSIDYIEAAGNYSVLHAPGGPFRVRQTMAAIEAAIDATQFVRVHRSFVVRIGAIREIQPWFHGDKKLVLQNGDIVNLSRRYRGRVEALHVAQHAASAARTSK